MTPFVQGIKLLLLLKGSFPRKGSNTLKILHYFSEKGSYPSIKLCFKLKLLGPSLGQWCTVGDFHEKFFRERTFPSSKAPHWHKTFIYVSKIETYQWQLLFQSKKVVLDTVKGKVMDMFTLAKLLFDWEEWQSVIKNVNYVNIHITICVHRHTHHLF